MWLLQGMEVKSMSWWACVFIEITWIANGSWSSHRRGLGWSLTILGVLIWVVDRGLLCGLEIDFLETRVEAKKITHYCCELWLIGGDLLGCGFLPIEGSSDGYSILLGVFCVVSVFEFRLGQN